MIIRIIININAPLIEIAKDKTDKYFYDKRNNKIKSFEKFKEEKKEVKKEEKKEEVPKEKKEEKKQEKKNGGNDVQNYDDIAEDIDIEDIEELSANKNSGNYNSSQTISQSQGGDNTVDSHVLENYNYVEQNEKK